MLPVIVLEALADTYTRNMLIDRYHVDGRSTQHLGKDVIS